MGTNFLVLQCLEEVFSVILRNNRNLNGKVYCCWDQQLWYVSEHGKACRNLFWPCREFSIARKPLQNNAPNWEYPSLKILVVFKFASLIFVFIILNRVTILYHQRRRGRCSSSDKAILLKDFNSFSDAITCVIPGRAVATGGVGCLTPSTSSE